MQRLEHQSCGKYVPRDGRLFATTFLIRREQLVLQNESISFLYPPEQKSARGNDQQQHKVAQQRREGPKHTVTLPKLELNAGVLGQIPLATVAGGALAGETRSAQRLDVERAVEASGIVFGYI